MCRRQLLVEKCVGLVCAACFTVVSTAYKALIVPGFNEEGCLDQQQNQAPCKGKRGDMLGNFLKA
jgi:hypothetical protein